MAARRRLRSSSGRSRAVGFRARGTEHFALGGDQPSRRPGVQPAAKFVHRPDRRKKHMRGRFVRRHILFAFVDVAPASLDIGFLRGQRLFAVVDLPDPCLQIALARLKRKVRLEHRPVALAQGCVLGRGTGRDIERLDKRRVEDLLQGNDQ